MEAGIGAERCRVSEDWRGEEVCSVLGVWDSGELECREQREA